MGARDTMSVNTSAELLSYIINSNPELSAEIDLPVQGESIAPIGKIIMSNQRYKNAFLNTINLIAVTVIKRNTWENPWDNFTIRGNIRNGQTVREIINDLANVYDYNQEMKNDTNNTRFLKTEVPNILQCLHEINFQKFYQVTTSDEQMAMAFEQGDLFSYIDDVVNMLFESFAYDRYIVNKYMLCKRIVDGTIPVKQIEDFASKTDRDIVAEIKAVSNKMTFRSPNYNPAGLRRATSFDDQIAIVNTDFDSKFTTNVLSTSYFRSDADMKARLALIDSFSSHDTTRLAELFAVRDITGAVVPNEYLSGYVPFTDDELSALSEVPCVIITREWFMNYRWSFDNASNQKVTEFYNPSTLKNNVFLHAWLIMSTSPFENCCVFSQNTPTVNSVSVSPSTASITKGQSLYLEASVNTTAFANQGVFWSINSDAETKGAKIDQNGKLTVPSDFVTTGSATAGMTTIAFNHALVTGDKVTVNGVTYTVDAETDDTVAKQLLAFKNVLAAASSIADYYSLSAGATVTITEKTQYIGLFDEPTVTWNTTVPTDVTVTRREAVIAGNKINAYATSIYDNTKSGGSVITVS